MILHIELDQCTQEYQNNSIENNSIPNLPTVQLSPFRQTSITTFSFDKQCTYVIKPYTERILINNINQTIIQFPFIPIENLTKDSQLINIIDKIFNQSRIS